MKESKRKGFKIEVTVYYALIAGDCGCENHSYKHRTVAQSSDEAVIEAMLRVKKLEAPLLSYGIHRIYWEHADWTTGVKDECGREKLTIFNKKNVSEIINS